MNGNKYITLLPLGMHYYLKGMLQTLIRTHTVPVTSRQVQNRKFPKKIVPDKILTQKYLSILKAIEN